jgi:hypothetical protein
MFRHEDSHTTLVDSIKLLPEGCSEMIGTVNSTVWHWQLGSFLPLHGDWFPNSDALHGLHESVCTVPNNWFAASIRNTRKVATVHWPQWGVYGACWSVIVWLSSQPVFQASSNNFWTTLVLCLFLFHHIIWGYFVGKFNRQQKISSRK